MGTYKVKAKKNDLVITPWPAKSSTAVHPSAVFTIRTFSAVYSYTESSHSNNIAGLY